MAIAALCFDGIDDDALVEAALPFLAAFSAVESWCAYSDEADRVLEEMVHRHHGPPHHSPHHADVDEEQARGIAERGCELLGRAGIAAAPHTIRGRDAGHALAQASGPGVALVLGAGHGREFGPKSIGHVARFVLDHARGPVMLLRFLTHS
jgi:nucleotide-binding universal stress UspA family protein